MGLAVGYLVPERWNLRVPVLVGLAIVATAWSWFSMDLRLGQRDSQGLPADPVVRGTSLSWQVCQTMQQLPLDRGQASDPALTFLQIPASDQAAEMAETLGPRWVAGTHLHESIGGTIGPRLVLAEKHGGNIRVAWVNALFNNPRQALVLTASGPDFKHWGVTPNAAFFAALTDVGMGRFERARKHLIRAADLQRTHNEEEATASFFYDPDQMIVPMKNVVANKEAFIDWTLGLLDKGHSPQEVGGLQDMFLRLLAIGTGMSYEELTAGSTLLVGPAESDSPAEQPGE
jgi:hypothetical protein